MLTIRKKKSRLRLSQIYPKFLFRIPILGLDNHTVIDYNVGASGRKWVVYPQMPYFLVTVP